jgi:hypothetical protein
MEHLGVATRQLRFGRDLRLKEVRHLLTSAATATVRLPNNPEVRPSPDPSSRLLIPASHPPQSPLPYTP